MRSIPWGRRTRRPPTFAEMLRAMPQRRVEWLDADFPHRGTTSDRDVLFKHLTKEQQQQFTKDNFFSVKRGDRTYHINVSGGVGVFGGFPGSHIPLCIHLQGRRGCNCCYEQLPGPLLALAMKLYLEANEELFLQTAGGGHAVLSRLP